MLACCCSARIWPRRLIGDLLTLARDDAGQQLSLQQVDVAALVEDVAGQAARLNGSIGRMPRGRAGGLDWDCRSRGGSWSSTVGRSKRAIGVAGERRSPCGCR